MDHLIDHSTIEAVYRSEAGRVLATLIRLVGDFELAEEGAQDAFEAALARWPKSGMPSNPRAWLVNTGRHKAIDRLRRRIALRGKLRVLGFEADTMVEPATTCDDIEDDQLRLIFTCCHPALALEKRVALTLRVVCGLSTPAIASIFLVSKDTMAQRLVRARSKIREAGIPYQVPGASTLPSAWQGCLPLPTSFSPRGMHQASATRRPGPSCVRRPSALCG